MKLIYNPLVNKVTRTFFRPLSSLMNEKYKFPVMGIYTLKNTKGGSFKFTCNETSCCGKMLFWDGVEGYEYNVVKVFIELIADAEVFFDIGSNIGYYSILAKSLNPDLKIVAFEPMPSPLKYIHKNIEINQYAGITVEQLALSSDRGEAEFTSVINPKFKHVEDQLAGDGSLFGEIGDNAEFKKVKVSIDTLDNYVKDHEIKKIDIIKLDVEAHEDEVLRGSDFVLREFKPIIFCEILEGRIEKEIEKIIKKYNYSIFKATEEGLVKQDKIVHDKATNDYILVPNKKENKIIPFMKK